MGKAIAELLPVTPSNVLDVATGTGFVAMIAAELGHCVTAIDLSEPMLEVARAEANRRGLKVTFLHDDAAAPNFPEKSLKPWSAATSSGRCVTRLERCATGVQVKPGGRVMAIDGFWFKPESDAGSASERSGLFEEF
jgi:protein-L-isoaspartate O-methyltransferase